MGRIKPVPWKVFNRRFTLENVCCLTHLRKGACYCEKGYVEELLGYLERGNLSCMASLIIRRKGRYIVVEVSFKEALKRRLERYLMRGESTSGVYFYSFAVLRCGSS